MRLGKLNIKRLEKQDIEIMKHVLKFIIFAFTTLGLLLYLSGGI